MHTLAINQIWDHNAGDASYRIVNINPSGDIATARLIERGEDTNVEVIVSRLRLQRNFTLRGMTSNMSVADRALYSQELAES